MASRQCWPRFFDGRLIGRCRQASRAVSVQYLWVSNAGVRNGAVAISWCASSTWSHDWKAPEYPSRANSATPRSTGSDFRPRSDTPHLAVMSVSMPGKCPISVMLDLGLEGLKESTGDFVRIAVVRRLDEQRQTEAESPMSIRDSGCSSLRQKIKHSHKCSR